MPYTLGMFPGPESNWDFQVHSKCPTTEPHQEGSNDFLNRMQIFYGNKSEFIKIMSFLIQKHYFKNEKTQSGRKYLQYL